MACRHRPWTAQTVGRCRAWHAIIALGQHKWSSVSCHHHPWAAHTVGRRRAWHAIIAFGQHIRSDGVNCGMPTSPLDSTHGRTTSDVACHHCLWAAYTVERRWAWHAIIAFGQYTRSNDVGTWHAIIALGQHTRSNDVGRGMPASPLGSTHGRTTSGVECHHLLWAADTVERRRAWHAIITFGKHTWWDGVGRGMPS